MVTRRRAMMLFEIPTIAEKAVGEPAYRRAPIAAYHPRIPTHQAHVMLFDGYLAVLPDADGRIRCYIIMPFLLFSFIHHLQRNGFVRHQIPLCTSHFKKALPCMEISLIVYIQQWESADQEILR